MTGFPVLSYFGKPSSSDDRLIQSSHLCKLQKTVCSQLAVGERTETNNTTRGDITEQFIAQYLLDDRELFEKPQIYYWNRQKQGFTSEIDFLTIFKRKVAPNLEVKSGAAGSMKLLPVFMAQKITIN